ncbi:MAG: hypothetical protein FWC40_10125 [Proteobacteria bacterium]|nr:hypothetical protein [Pseudomonadota bacterium]
MLSDRCLMTKQGDEWVGIVELIWRQGARWRFVAWIAGIILVLEAFRLSQISFWHFSFWEYLVMFVSAIVAVFAFLQSARRLVRRAVVIRLPRQEPVFDDVGQIAGVRQSILLPGEEGKYDHYDASRFSHIVFGLIDYPWPGRKDVSIDAYALYLAEHDGTPHAIVEASFDKYSCFALARRIAVLTKIPLIELGKGQPFVSVAGDV